jgi:hypothetical protein
MHQSIHGASSYQDVVIIVVSINLAEDLRYIAAVDDAYEIAVLDAWISRASPIIFCNEHPNACCVVTKPMSEHSSNSGIVVRGDSSVDFEGSRRGAYEQTN